jgi:hypothetical protein
MPAVVSMQVYGQVQLFVSVQISCPDDLKVRFVSRSVSRVQHLCSPAVGQHHLGVGEIRSFASRCNRYRSFPSVISSGSRCSNGGEVPNGTARESARRLLSSVIFEAGSEGGASPNIIEGHRDEVCTSTQEQSLFVLWAPISCNEPWQHRRMRRRAPTRGGSAERSPASRQTERPRHF